MSLKTVYTGIPARDYRIINHSKLRDFIKRLSIGPRPVVLVLDQLIRTVASPSDQSIFGAPFRNIRFLYNLT